jgi:hypothetical protein
VRNAHHHERRDHGEEADAVDQEAPALTESGDDEPGERWSDEPGTIRHRGIDRDGVAEIVAVVHHLHKEGLAGRHIEGVDKPLQHTECDDLANRDAMAEGECGHGQRLDRCSSLRPEQQTPAAEPLHPHGGKGAKQERDNLSGKADET